MTPTLIALTGVAGGRFNLKVRLSMDDESLPEMGQAKEAYYTFGDTKVHFGYLLSNGQLLAVRGGKRLTVGRTAECHLLPKVAIIVDAPPQVSNYVVRDKVTA